MSLTPEQIEMRRTGITSTDIAAICGLNPYKSPMAVYLDKIGKPIPVEETEAMYWGNALEGPIARRYGRENRVYAKRSQHTFRHPRIEWLLATPDARVYTRKRHVRWGRDAILWGLELKTAGSTVQVARWGPSGGAVVPEEYLVQCAWCMAVCDLDRWDLAVFLGTYHGFEYRQYTLTRDLALEAKLIEIGREFWFERVQKHNPPAPDGSASSGRALAQLYPADETAIMPADDDTQGLVQDLWIAKQDFEDATREFDRCKQELRAAIKTAEGVEGQGFKVTWKANKKGSRVFRYSGKLFRQSVEVQDD